MTDTYTLADLRLKYGVQFNPNLPFFSQWLNEAPAVREAERRGLDRLTSNYNYLLQEDSLLGEAVKLAVVSPLLDLAGFFQPPFSIKSGAGYPLTETANEPGTISQTKFNSLVVQDGLCILAMESVPVQLDVTAGVPSALYRLLIASTSRSVLYGMVTNGREVVFLRLDRSESPYQYCRSLTYRLLENAYEREQVLQGLVYLGGLLFTEQ